jgi:hypothetical protein
LSVAKELPISEALFNLPGLLTWCLAPGFLDALGLELLLTGVIASMDKSKTVASSPGLAIFRSVYFQSLMRDHESSEKIFCD